MSKVVLSWLLVAMVTFAAAVVWAADAPAVGKQPAPTASTPAAPGDAATAKAALVTVAVLDYEAASPGNPDLGSQIAEIMTARLSVEDGLDLVERAKLGQILKEQHLPLVGLADPQQAAQIGKLLGAKLLVMGKAFMMDSKLMIVTKVVGVETGLVKGTLRSVEQSKPLSEAVALVSEDVAALVRRDAAKLLPADVKLEDPVAQIRKDLGDRPRPAVAVIIPEQHRTRVVIDPAVETEIKHLLVECGFRVVDTGRNDLADWAKGMMHGQKAPWPAALADADLIVVGEAFSEFALRTGDLVTCAARAEINLISRHSGEILLADRDTQRAVDLAEAIAGKTALQKAGRRLGVTVCRRLVAYKGPMAKPAGPPAPAAAPAGAKEGAAPAAGSACATSAMPRLTLILEAPLQEKPATSEPPKSTKRTVFAARFENETGQEQYDPAAAGMGDLVGVLLAERESVRVVERQRLEALADEQARSLKGLTGEAHALQAGRLFKADTVITGRLFLLEGRMTVSAKAIDIATERVVASDQVSGRPEDIFEVALQLAGKLAKQMEWPLPKIDLAQIDKSPVAGLHFAKALSHYYAGNMDEAIMQFMRAIDLDPNYTEVHYWTGLCYEKLGEPTHAVIDFEAYLKEHPQGKYAQDAAKRLAVAKEKAAAETIPRLGPPDKPKPGEPVKKSPIMGAKAR
jgi:TolB-like protein